MDIGAQFISEGRALKVILVTDKSYLCHGVQWEPSESHSYIRVAKVGVTSAYV